MGELSDAVLLRRAPTAAVGIDRPRLNLRIEDGIGIAKLQILERVADERFVDMMGSPDPRPRTQVEADGLTVAWLAPGEWLLIGEAARLTGRLPGIAAVGGDDALLVDLSHARTSFLLSGDDAREALAAHCPLDLRADAFPAGAVARSTLADAGMFIARLGDEPDGPRFRLVVDQTMAGYAARMLAGPPFRIGAFR